jgi:hypothetical protein
MDGRQKREARRQAARLLGLGRVSPAASIRTDEERVRDALQGARTEDVYEDAAGCADCQDERRRSKDDTALCDRHLMRAMSFDRKS